jgi:hypothetical protein
MTNSARTLTEEDLPWLRVTRSRPRKLYRSVGSKPGSLEKALRARMHDMIDRRCQRDPEYRQDPDYETDTVVRRQIVDRYVRLMFAWMRKQTLRRYALKRDNRGVCRRVWNR